MHATIRYPLRVVAERVDVVVVDDGGDVREVLARILELDGRFRVVAQGKNGEDAVALAATYRPALLILDVSMQGVDGLEALPRILSLSPSTKVVVFSGFTSPSLEAMARDLGAADVIEKGAPIARLPARLATLFTMGVATASTAMVGPAPIEPETETVLARHIERYHNVFEQGSIGMATMTLSGTVVRVNRALCAMLEADGAALVGRRYSTFGGGQTTPLLDDAIREVASGQKEVVAVEHSSLRGLDHWVRSTVASVRGLDGAALYLFVQVEDVTDRRRAIDELRRSEERFRLLVEGVRDYAIFMLDPTGHVTTWNLGAERMKGYAAEEIIGRHFRTFYEPDAQARRHPEEELELAVVDGRYEEEGWRVRKDGSKFWANVVITALFDQSGELAGFAKVTKDITERRLAAQAQEAAARELEAANARLAVAAEETAEFVAMTAHELRSPIAAVTGAASVLRDYWEVLTDVDRRDTLDNIIRGGERLHRLIEDLLTVSRIEAGSFEFHLEDVLLRRAIDEACAEQGPALGHVAVSCPEGVMVRGDRLRCLQILTNLLANAAIHGSPPVDVAVSLSRGSDMAEVQVHDSGSGPLVATVEQLFAKFTQGAGRQHRGTGLGLYIVRELARGQGGDAWFERDPKGGGSFCFSLPLAAPVAEPGDSRD